MRGNRTKFDLTGGVLATFLVLALAAIGCQSPLPMTAANSAVPETASADWPVLRSLVTRYEGNRGGVHDQVFLTLQSDFSKIYENHANDRIGDEALYYYGRIAYDLRDYHTARVTFRKHREQFRQSEFTSTITLLEAEMDRSDAEYRRWLEESRAASSSTK